MPCGKLLRLRMMQCELYNYGACKVMPNIFQRASHLSIERCFEDGENACQVIVMLQLSMEGLVPHDHCAEGLQETIAAALCALQLLIVF
jgi:hypothetical protein